MNAQQPWQKTAATAAGHASLHAMHEGICHGNMIIQPHEAI
jgi:hypothetical protein